jgi:hypothetical protein
MKKGEQKADKVKISLDFPKDLWKALKMRALQDDETATGILVRLAEAYLVSKKKKG